MSNLSVIERVCLTASGIVFIWLIFKVSFFIEKRINDYGIQRYRSGYSDCKNGVYLHRIEVKKEGMGN